jgi:hypothetical protein
LADRKKRNQTADLLNAMHLKRQTQWTKRHKSAYYRQILLQKSIIFHLMSLRFATIAGVIAGKKFPQKLTDA